MSETETRRRIRAMASPRDRQVMRFVLDQAVGDGRKASFAPPAGDAPLARALFAIDGVMKFETADETILVTIAPDRDWQTLKAPVAAAIRAALDSSDEPLGPKPQAPAANDDDAALLAAVSDLLETRANPSIASHGGRITAEAVENGSVYLRMSGGCQGCAASAVTLRKGVETMLRAALPRQMVMEMGLLGRPVPAARLAELGVISALTPPGAALDTALNLARDLAAGPRTAQARIKHQINTAAQTDLATQQRLEARDMNTARFGPEAAEGLAAFLEKRIPRFPD